MLINGSINNKNRNEHQLLLYCARTRIDVKIKSKIKSLTQENIDWDYLIELASLNALTPLLYYNLNNICPQKVPHTILEQLKDKFNKIIRYNLLLTAELLKILNLLKSHEIIAIPYKGPVLAISAYGNLAFREFCDLDILIDKSDALKVGNILISNGYKLVSHLDDKEKSLDLYLKIQREYKFINEETGIIFEIQWNYNDPISLPVDPYFLSQKDSLETVELFGSEIHILSPENLFLVLCMHVASHDWTSLLWICDISEIIKTYNLDWDLILENANKLKIKRIVLINLFIANDLFNLKLPNKLINQLNYNEDLRKLSNKIKTRLFFKDNINFNFISKAKFDFDKRENKLLGLKDSIKDILKPTLKDFEYVNLPVNLVLLYYFIRPIRLLKRYKLGKIN